MEYPLGMADGIGFAFHCGVDCCVVAENQPVLSVDTGWRLGRGFAVPLYLVDEPQRGGRCLGNRKIKYPQKMDGLGAEKHCVGRFAYHPARTLVAAGRHYPSVRRMKCRPVSVSA